MAQKPRTKAELETALTAANERELEAQTRATTAEQRAEEAEAVVEHYQTREVPQLPGPVAEQPDPFTEVLPDPERVGGPEDGTEREYMEPELLFDPYASQNPHKFIAHPPGFKLGWKNPKYRDGHRGWRGWVQVEHTDEIGRNLDKYLLDPPHRMAHEQDNYVRRGDVILCILPEEWWMARQQARTRKAQHMTAEHRKYMTQDRVTKRGDLNVTLPDDPNRVGGRTMTS